MDAILRAAAIYLLLLLLFRISGKRSLAQITIFDFVVLLIVAEATQQAMLGDDFSVTNGLIVVSTLIGLDLLFQIIARRSTRFERFTEGMPLIVVEEGEVHHERLAKSRLSVDDVLEALRGVGLERLDQAKYVVLERSGGLSVIPNSPVMRQPAES